MKTASKQTRLISGLFALVASTAVLGGTVAAMASQAQPQVLPVVVMERTLVHSATN